MDSRLNRTKPKSKRKRSERTPKATEVSLSATCSRFLLSRAQIFAISAAEEWCLYSSLSKKRLGRLATSLEGAMSSLLFPRTDRFKFKLGQTRDGRQKHLFLHKAVSGSNAEIFGSCRSLLRKGETHGGRLVISAA